MQPTSSLYQRPPQLSPLAKAARLLNRRVPNGQSLVLIAIGFIALIAFVGIVTDVSLLFVRFNALRRAVDSAAIAVAGQIREGTDFGTLNAVAQQHIQLQGNFDTQAVLVETCETDIFNYIRTYIEERGLPANTVITSYPDPVTGQPVDPRRDVIRGTGWLYQTRAAANKPYPLSELCKLDPQKLVRVSAQLDSPTTFLALLGQRTVRLATSSLSQTAVLDVALVLDTSESMAQDTFNLQWQGDYAVDPNPGGDNSEALRRFKPFLPGGDPSDPLKYPGLNLEEPGNPEPAIRSECYKPVYPRANPLVESTEDPVTQTSEGSYDTASNYAWGGCCNDPGTQSHDGIPDPTTTGNPLASTISAYNGAADPGWYLYDDGFTENPVIQVDGVNPALNNKPSARMLTGRPDGNYSDLICQPFKQVRDAARRFINRLDFVRGDRLVLVTFAMDATAIRPTYVDSSTIPPVLLDKQTAIRTLNFKVGLFIQPSGHQQLCITTANGLADNNTPYAENNPKDVVSYWTVAQCTSTNTGGAIYVARSALFNPAWVRNDAVHVMVLLSDGFPNRTPSAGVQGVFSNPTAPEVDWLEVRDTPLPVDPTPGSEYDRFCVDTASADYATKPWLCTNAPAWQYNNRFPYQRTSPNEPQLPQWEDSRSWGFCPWYTFCRGGIVDPDAGNGVIPTFDPKCSTAMNAGLGVYPSGSYNNPGPFYAPGRLEPSAPFCVDNDPDSRHFCTDRLGRANALADEGETGTALVFCDHRYDADDFARDQADAAGLLIYDEKLPTPGNFIAMFSVLFQKYLGNPDEYGRLAGVNNILGVKFMRYMADAGDNGKIDNALQAWYRKTHASPTTAPGGDPGKFGGLQADSQIIDSVCPTPGWTPGRAIAGGLVACRVSGTGYLRYFGQQEIATKHGFQLDPDPCTPYDYNNFYDDDGSDSTSADGNGPLPYDSAITSDFQKIMRVSCGQYYYASEIEQVNKAFTDITGRLFTRLAR